MERQCSGNTAITVAGYPTRSINVASFKAESMPAAVSKHNSLFSVKRTFPTASLLVHLSTSRPWTPGIQVVKNMIRVKDKELHSHFLMYFNFFAINSFIHCLNFLILNWCHSLCQILLYQSECSLYEQMRLEILPVFVHMQYDLNLLIGYGHGDTVFQMRCTVKETKKIHCFPILSPVSIYFFF